MALLLVARSARAQFQGFSSPLTFQTTPASNVSCTGAQQTFAVANQTQTEHFATLLTSAAVVGIRMTVQGSHDATNYSDISDVATVSGNTVVGQGYYPLLRIAVTCADSVGTFTVNYSGQATAPAPQMGAQMSAQIDKTLANGAAAGANFTSQVLRSPFGNSGGALYFQYNAAGPSGSVLNINCGTFLISPPSFSIASFPLSAASTIQAFPVLLTPCDFLTVSYTAGGASAQTFNLSYVFNATAITGGDPCQAATVPKSSAIVNVASATQQLVAPLAGHSVLVCGYQFTLQSGGVPATAQFVGGTGATCGVAAVNLSGTFTGTPNASLPIPPASGYNLMKTASNSGLCLIASGAGSNAQGVLTFIQQ